MSEDVDLGTPAASTEPTMSDVLSDDSLGAAFDAAEAGESGPIRDEHGRFAAREGDDPAPEEITPDEGVTEAPDEVVTGEAPEAPAPIVAPQSMSAADREAFAKLPPESQKWLADRERQMTADYTKKSMETAEKGKTYERLEQIIAPRRQQLQMQGMDESTAIGQLFALSDFAERDPVAFARYLLSNRGIDPSQAFSAAAEQSPTDPAILATQRELAGIKQFIQQTQAQQEAAQHHAAQSAIESFVNEVKDGKPLRPYYAQLEPEMVPIVQQLRQAQPGKAPTEYLQMAYDRAVWANPETRALMQQETSQQASAQAIARQKEAAAAAKRKAASNVTSSGVPRGKDGKPATMDDTLSMTYDTAQGVA